MFSGWTIKWRLNRLLTPDEYSSALPRQRQENIEPDDRGTAVAFNSTYVEFVGRRFRLRGGIISFLATLGIFLFISVPAVVFYTGPSNSANTISTLIVAIFTFGWATFLWLFFLRKEYFSHTYYPIRFNRKTREVYVFRDKRDGGIITVPWDEGYFHIGEGLRDKQLLDLRCHIMGQDNVVKDTFVTGMYYSQPEPVQQIWEFIRRYMDEGIESLGEVEIWTTPKPTLQNCNIMAGVFVGGSTSGIRSILWIIAGPIMITRYLVLKTCKPPVWPANIEAKCAIEPNDPHRLPEPEYIGQFGVERERAKARVL